MKKNKNKTLPYVIKEEKLIQIIKKKWLIDGTKTFILIAGLVAIFIGINIFTQNLELTPLDFSQEKLHTLTEESKEKVKNINKEVNIYFVGYSEENTTLNLAKQYNKINSKITAQEINSESRPDLINKYEIDNRSQGIIVECENNSKVLTDSDLITYDINTNQTISIAEEKLTSSILYVTTEKTPKIYFLMGYSQFSLNANMNLLNVFLQNEINDVENLDILTTGKIPEDCDTLVITTPNKDFDDVATNAIIEYINSGKNILWLNAAVTTKIELPNVNKILELYGIEPFEVGIIRETNPSKMATNTPNLVKPDIKNSKVTKNIYNTTGVMFINPTKVNIDEDKLEELNIIKTDLAIASETSYFRTDFEIQSDFPTQEEKKGTFIVGAELEKILSKENEETGENKKSSKMIIYGENYFITDYPISQDSKYSAIQMEYNKNLLLNSISYLVDREEDIVARKSTETVVYTATEQQDNIVKSIIFIVPAIIIILGIVIWQKRRRKK